MPEFTNARGRHHHHHEIATTPAIAFDSTRWPTTSSSSNLDPAALATTTTSSAPPALPRHGTSATANPTAAATVTRPRTTSGGSSARRSTERKASFAWLREPVALADDARHKPTTVWLALARVAQRAADAVAIVSNVRPTTPPLQAGPHHRHLHPLQHHLHHSPLHVDVRCTWTEYFTRARAMAKVLVHLGFARGEGAVVSAGASPMLWVLTMAVLAIGGRVCHIRDSWAPHELTKGIFPSAQASILIVDTLSDSFLRAVREYTSATASASASASASPASPSGALSSSSSQLRAVIVLQGYSPERVLQWNLPVTVLGLDELLHLAVDTPELNLDAVTGRVVPSDVALISFAYDAQGHVRGTCLSHDNVMFTAATLATCFGPLSVVDSLVAHVPLHHVSAQVLEQFMPLLNGLAVCCAPTYQGLALASVITRFRPTIFFATPASWAQISRLAYKAKSEVHAAAFLSRWAHTRATNNSAKLRFGQDAHRSLGYILAQKLVLNALKKKIGLASCASCYSILAPLDFELETLFKSIDVPIYQLYGSPETSGFAAINFPHSWEFGSSGRALPGTLLQYDEQAQQVMHRGRNVFLGYVQPTLPVGRHNSRRSSLARHPRGGGRRNSVVPSVSTSVSFQPSISASMASSQSSSSLTSFESSSSISSSSSVSPSSMASSSMTSASMRRGRQNRHRPQAHSRRERNTPEDETSTQQDAQSDGWFRFAQRGHLTPEGFLKISDAPRDFIVLASGDWVPTLPFEEVLSRQPALERAVLVGDGRDFLSVLLFLSTATVYAPRAASMTVTSLDSAYGGNAVGYGSSAPSVRRLTATRDHRHMGATATGGTALLSEDALRLSRSMGSTATTVRDVVRCPYWAVHFDRLLASLPQMVGLSGFQVRKWVVMTAEFTVEGGELDPDTGDVLRRVVDGKYKSLLDSLYNQTV